jgi:hypothetical protein
LRKTVRQVIIAIIAGLFVISLFGSLTASANDAASNEQRELCGDPDHQGKTFWDVHNILVHIEPPSGPPENYSWPHPVGGNGLWELVSPLVKKNLLPCITAPNGSITYISRGYDERISDKNTLTVLIWSDFEGYSRYRTRERSRDPEFVVMHVGFYRPLEPKAQFLDWRLIKSTKITFNDPAAPVADQIRAFLDEALKPRKYKPHPEGSLTKNIRKIQDEINKGR